MICFSCPLEYISRINMDDSFLFYRPRGDGFPLANMLAMVSTQLPEEFITMLQSHIYMVCPTAIPTLPKPLPGSSEVDLMESLGMIKDKNGSYETFERFLGRTEVRKVARLKF